MWRVFFVSILLTLINKFLSKKTTPIKSVFFISLSHSLFLFILSLISNYNDTFILASAGYFLYDIQNSYVKKNNNIVSIAYIVHHLCCVFLFAYLYFNYLTLEFFVSNVIGMIELSSAISHIITLLNEYYPYKKYDTLKFISICSWIYCRIIYPLSYYHETNGDRFLIISFDVIFIISIAGIIINSYELYKSIYLSTFC